MPASLLRALSLAAAIVTLALCTGCGKKSTTAPPSGVTSDALVSSADSVLALVLYDQINLQPHRPSDRDFQTPYHYYTLAYQDPHVSAAGRERARFGLAVLGLLILTSDTEVNAAFDEWAAYLHDHVPFEIRSSPQTPLGIRTGFGPAREMLRLPFDVAPLSLLSLARSPLDATDPQLSGVQAILRDRALPRLTAAIMHLDAVAADPGFVFVVTPAMQGDLAADPVEIDRTDILALRAGCKLLLATCRVAVAYVLSFPAYDEASLLAALQPNSTWLSLAPDGLNQMQLAQLDLVGSVDDVSATISSLLAETDPQDDDVIRVGPGGLAARDLDSLRTRLPLVRQWLTSGFTLTADWDSNPTTPDVPLRINPGALFTNPVPDWKAMLPAYTGSTERRPLGAVPVENYGVPVKATFIPSTDGYYSGSYSLSVYPGGTYETGSGDTTVVGGLQRAVQSRFKYVQALPGWGGDYYASCSFDGNLTAGTQSVQTSIAFEYYSLASSVVAVPVITWRATQFSEWTWPDPMFRGLLPDMGSSDQLLATFGVGASQWQRQVVLDWTRWVYPWAKAGPPPPSAPGLRGRGPAAMSRGGR